MRSKRSNNFKRVEEIENYIKKSGALNKLDKGKGDYAFAKQKPNKMTNKYQKQSEELDLNRLDLIFQKQPKEIQQKLIKLLISYNAIMQYNRETDMFEVDLLLPFLNQDQKRQFIKQFLEIRRQKNNKQPTQSLINPQQSIVKQFEDSVSKPKQIRKFSFNNNYMDSSNQYEFFKNQGQMKMMDQINYQQEMIERQKQQIIFIKDEPSKPRKKSETLKELNQNALFINESQHHAINLEQLQKTIANRLKNAVNIINRNRGRIQLNQEDIVNSKPMLIDEDQPKNQESIIEQLSLNNINLNNSQKFNQQKNLSMSQYIREDLGDQELALPQQSLEYRHSDNYHNYHSQQEKYREVIFQQQEEQQYEPLFDNRKQRIKVKPKDHKVTSFQDYTLKLTNLKQEKKLNKQTPAVNNKNDSKKKIEVKKSNEVDVSQRYWSSKQKQSRQQIPQKNKQDDLKTKRTHNTSSQRQQSFRSKEKSTKSVKSHSNSLNKDKSHLQVSKQSRKIKNHVNQFFNLHRQYLNKLYSQIQVKIEQSKGYRSSPPKSEVKSQKYKEQSSSRSLQNFILVLDDLDESEQDQSLFEHESSPLEDKSQFKQQIIRQYKKEIIVNNRNLSSEDLIRYFRYLHSNAKRLYVRYLSNKQQ